MHNQNYETNPTSASRKWEDAVSGVRFIANKRQKAGLNQLQNEPNVCRPFRSRRVSVGHRIDNVVDADSDS
jgi:hypothetical protein